MHNDHPRQTCAMQQYQWLECWIAETAIQRTDTDRQMINHRILQSTALRYFLEVARVGSITDAAERLNVAPSTVSRQIARLERELDFLVFERRARGMALNAAGELLAAHAKRMQQDIERVTGDMLRLRGLQQGHVRLVSTEGYAFDFIPSAVASFRQTYGGIRFSLEACSQHEIPNRIRDGDADIGFTLTLTSERDIRVELRRAAPVLAVMSSDHPLSGQSRLSIAQIVQYPLALPDPDSTVRQLFDISCSRQQLQYDPAFVSRHIDSLINFVAAGGGILLCGELAISNRLRQGGITARSLKDREMNERQFEVQTLAGRTLSSASKAFLEHIRQMLPPERG